MLQLAEASENSRLFYALQGFVQPQADPTISPDRDWFGIFAVVHYVVNQVALFATCRHICKFTPLVHIAGCCPARD
jgi:hypothetical protein